MAKNYILRVSTATDNSSIVRIYYKHRVEDKYSYCQRTIGVACKINHRQFHNTYQVR